MGLNHRVESNEIDNKHTGVRDLPAPQYARYSRSLQGRSALLLGENATLPGWPSPPPLNHWCF